MSVVSQRNIVSQYGLRQIQRAVTWESALRALYTSLMGVLLLSFLYRMAFYSKETVTPSIISTGQMLSAILGIWLGKTWKDRGFHLMLLYALWMTVRCYAFFRQNSGRIRVLEHMFSLIWAVGGCYSLGRILSVKEMKRFFQMICLIWTGGMAVSSGLGIAAAWGRIQIPNLSGSGFWRIWGEASSARLNLVYCATVSGGILSFSILTAVLAGLHADTPALKGLFGFSTIPMVVALCLTDSRTAQITLSFGLSLLFLFRPVGSSHMAGGTNRYSRRESPIVFRAVLNHFRADNAAGKFSLKTGSYLILKAVLLGILIFYALHMINPAFDAAKIWCTEHGFLPSGAVSEDTTILMANRGLLTEDVLTGRDQIWKAVYSFFMKHPGYLLYGTSLVGTMNRIVDQSVLTFKAGHCHNILLQVLVAGGLFAFLPLTGFIFHVGKNALHKIRKGRSSLFLMIVCLLLTLFIGDMVECFTWFGNGYSPLPFIPFLLCGMITAPEEDRGNASLQNRRKHRLPINAFRLGCVLLLCTALMLSYHPSVPVVHQDDYDNPETDLFYECGIEDCPTHQGKHTIKTSGCGLCAVSNAVSYMTGSSVDVRELAAFAREKEQYIVHEGSKSSLAEEAAKHLGKKYGFCYIGQVSDLREATGYIRQGCTVIAGVGNGEGGGHLLVIADYNPLLHEYLILDSAGNYDHWSREFCSWQKIEGDHLSSNPEVFLTSLRILAPVRLKKLADTLNSSGS